MSTATAATSIYKTGNLYQVPPGTLVLERNIRAAKPDDDLVASVKQLGVMQPITAVVGADGRLLVRLGERRTLAAIEAKQPTVPVYVAGVDDTEAAAEILRIISQRDENTVRAGLTDAEDLGVVEQLSAFGLSHDEIVDQARIARDRVETAATVSDSKLAKGAIAKYEALTLEHAAAVAEFEADTETAKGLIVTALEEPARFAHALQRARDERADAAARAAASKELEDSGVKIIEPPYYGSKVKAERLDYLTDGKKKVLTPEGHKDCPGHVAWLSSMASWETVDGKEQRVTRYAPVYGCTAPAKNGHKDRYGGSSSSKTSAADMTDAEREAAKKARRLVIDNNKAWNSATTVRRAWLVEFAKTKTAPKGSAAFIAQALAGERMWLSDYRVPAIVAELLGAKTGTGLEAHVAGLLKNASEQRAQVIALAQILAAIEATTSQQTWRENGTKSVGGRYLRFLETAGYGLSDVEKFAISSRTA